VEKIKLNQFSKSKRDGKGGREGGRKYCIRQLKPSRLVLMFGKLWSKTGTVEKNL
jgi:hypothetical protein